MLALAHTLFFESTLKVLYAVDYYTFYKRRRDNSNTAMRARMAQCALPYSSHTPECVCVGGGGGGGELVWGRVWVDIIFILVCSTTKGDIFQFPVLLHVGSFLSLPHPLLPLASLPLPLSLSEEEAGSGKFTSC